MCVIIIKQPGVTIPKAKIESACIVNADGFGISVIKGSELLTFKNYNPKGNDPDEVYRLMTEYHDLPQFIHLRFTTKGQKSMDNCHPFTLLETPEYQIHLMHNGTLYDFGPKGADKRSDTRIFAEDFATPLTQAFFALVGADAEGKVTPIHNTVYQDVMEKYSGNGYLVTYDNFGNYHVAGGKGHQHEGWWSSNEYSFNRTHREPAKTYYNRSYNGQFKSPYSNETYYANDETDPKKSPWDDTYTRYDGVTMRWSDDLKKYIEVVERLPALPAPSSTPTKGNEEVASSSVVGGTVVEKDKDAVPFRKLYETDNTIYQTKLLGYALSEAKRKKLAFASHVPPTKRTSLLELSDLSNLEDFCLLSVDEIEDMVTELPEAAALLIMDLLYELYTSKRNVRKAA